MTQIKRNKTPNPFIFCLISYLVSTPSTRTSIEPKLNCNEKFIRKI